MFLLLSAASGPFSTTSFIPSSLHEGASQRPLVSDPLVQGVGDGLLDHFQLSKLHQDGGAS